MREIIRLIVVLSVICAVSAGLLALVSNFTKEPIAKALREEKLKALREVLPPYDNEPDQDVVKVDNRDVYIARKDGRAIGYALSTVSHNGYGGDIVVLVGISPESDITGIEILQMAETPGLGAKIQTPAFRDAFKGKSLTNATWKVKKDNGDFPEFAGATISPRAVVSAVHSGLEFFKNNKDAITAAVK